MEADEIPYELVADSSDRGGVAGATAAGAVDWRLRTGRAPETGFVLAASFPTRYRRTCARPTAACRSWRSPPSSGLGRGRERTSLPSRTSCGGGGWATLCIWAYASVAAVFGGMCVPILFLGPCGLPVQLGIPAATLAALLAVVFCGCGPIQPGRVAERYQARFRERGVRAEYVEFFGRRSMS